MDPKSKKNRRKENQKENRKDGKNGTDALNQLLTQKAAIEISLRQECSDLKAKYEKKRDAESARRAENQRLDQQVIKLKLSEEALLQEIADMRAEWIPLIAAVVMKTIYKKAADIQPKEHTARQDDRIEKMRQLGAGFKAIGYEEPKLVAEFVEIVS